MHSENIVKLALDYAAYFEVANMSDPDEVQGAAELFTYYCREKCTPEERELLCKVAADEVLRLKAEKASEKEISFYESIPTTVHYFDTDEDSV